MTKTPFTKTIAGLVGIFLLLVILVAPPLRAKADPVTAIIGFAVFAFGALVVVDAFSCDINVFWGCPSGKDGGGTGGPIPPVTKPGIKLPVGVSNNGNNNGGNGGGGVGTPCGTRATNSCGMSGTGFVVNGACTATVPPNSACPVPVIAQGSGFYAEPNLVKATNQAILHWNVTDALSCTITGGGLSLSNLGITGSTQTSPISAKTVFTLTCQNGAGGPTNSANATVNLVPSFQEI